MDTDSFSVYYIEKVVSPFILPRENGKVCRVPVMFGEDCWQDNPQTRETAILSDIKKTACVKSQGTTPAFVVWQCK
jgi:hypothetical protein